ncbi:MAG: exo-alpha-sialidase [Clostridia bacterium]|nr:exo-alpha-sialidase [Clostridia bacterium]
MKHGIVGRCTEGWFRYQAWPTVARDKNGILYTVCSGHRLAHVCPFGKNLMYISEDHGESWSSPVIVNDSYLDDRDAGILTWGESDMMLTWFNNEEEIFDLLPWRSANIDSPLSLGMREMWKGLEPDTEYIPGAWCKFSHDNGKTWSEPRRSPVSAPHGAIRLKDGRILYVGIARFWPGFEEDSIHAFSTTDEGKTWQHESAVPILTEWKDLRLEGACEPHCVELPNGDILVGIRNREVRPDTKDIQRISMARSKDGGKTWEEPWVLDDMIGSPPHFCLRKDGALILSYGRRREPFGEYVRISYDNGYTWTEDIMIRSAPDWDLGYPASVELEDGGMLTVYYQKHGDDPYNSILYTKWDMPDR